MRSFKILCNCKHEFQDKEHGNRVRVANPTSKKYPDGTIDVRCTVCGTIHKQKQYQVLNGNSSTG